MSEQPVLQIRKCSVWGWVAECHGTQSYDWLMMVWAWRPSRAGAIEVCRRKAMRVQRKANSWERVENK